MVGAAAMLGSLAGLVHIGFWVLESVWWRRPSVWRQFGVRSQQEADAVAFNMLNQGYYNLFLGAGAVVGALLFAVRGEAILLGFCCVFMLGAGVVLFAARRAMWRAALVQGVLPALALFTLAAS